MMSFGEDAYTGPLKVDFSRRFISVGTFGQAGVNTSCARLPLLWEV